MSKLLELDYDPDQFSDANTYGYGSAVGPTSSSGGGVGGGLGFSVGGALALPYQPIPAGPTPPTPTYGNPTGSPAFSYEAMSILYQLGQALQPWAPLLDRQTLTIGGQVSLGNQGQEGQPAQGGGVPAWVWILGGLGVAGLVLVLARKE
jgi:hypothetical protein